MGSSKKERSRTYPVMELSEALTRVGNISQNLGLRGKFNRESIAVGMGYSSLSGSSTRAVAALAQYGLLVKDKDQYSLSDTAIKYVVPRDDAERQESVRHAALSPALFAEIYGILSGQVIPRQFTNRLIQDFGIQQKVAGEVERIFRKTMETAGILNQNGVLEEVMNGDAPDISPRPSNNESAGFKPVLASYLTVELPSGIVVSYPSALAPAFAFGVFGKEMKALDEAVSGSTAGTKEGQGE